MVHMILKDHFSGVVDGAADSCQLHQNFGAIVSLFHHPLHLFQMTDGPGQTVEHSLLIGVDMAVGVGDTVGVEIAVGMIVFVMVGHIPMLLSLFRHIIPHFLLLRKPVGGIFPRK